MFPVAAQVPRVRRSCPGISPVAVALSKSPQRFAVVTNDIFVSFLHCNRKAFQLATGATGQPTDIETVLIDLGHSYRRHALAAFLAKHREQDIVRDPPDLEAALKSKPQVIVNATASVDGLSSLIDHASFLRV